MLLKDLLFVVPAYIGFFGASFRRNKSWTFEGAPVVLMLLLTGLVLAQMLNPNLPNVLVGLIGAKIWLTYLPMMFLGYHFVRSKEEVFSALGFMCLVALVPALAGILQALLIRAGNIEAAYRLYGDASNAVTQNFVEFRVGGGSIRRVSSTFSFWTQFYAFSGTMVAVSYAWWRGHLARKGRTIAGAIVCGVMVAACMLSGARAAILLVPLMLIVTILLDMKHPGELATKGAVVAGVFILPMVVFRTSVSGLMGSAFETGVADFGHSFLGSFRIFFSELVGIRDGSQLNRSALCV